jgi:antitoxin ParD1/3/4
MSGEAGAEEVEPEANWTQEQLAALKELLAERMRGEFLDREQSDAQIEALIAAKRKEYGL